jgi:predicted permease
LFRHETAEVELAREVAAHLALIQEDLQRQGMSTDEARRAARREFGGIEQAKSLHREARSFPWLEQAVQDLRYACRTLSKSPGFTASAVLALTLGVGVNATLFSAYNAVALKPLPVAHASEVVRIERWFQSGSRGDMQYAFSYPEYAYCRDHNHAFASLVAASWAHPVYLEDGSHAAAELVSANYFADLGIGTRLGRTFLPAEDRTPGANPVMVISYPFWQHRFHGDPQALGQTVKVNGADFTVVGVAPETFTGTSTFPQVPDFWAPVSMQAQIVPGRNWLEAPDDLEFQVLARIGNAATLRSAQAEADLLIRQYAATYRQRDRMIAATLEHTAAFGNTADVRFKALVAALMLLVGSVLLVACANVANMLLARGAGRQKEIALRLAMGASRSRVIRQLLTESLLLALLGGLGGVIVSVWTTKFLWLSVQQFLAGSFAETVVLTLNLSPDMRVLGYAFALSLITGVLFGLSPALQFSKPDLTMALKNEGTFFGQRWSNSRIRGALVTMQVAVSMGLLIITGLLLRGMVRDQDANPGFDTHNVILVYGDLGNDLARSIALERRLVERLHTLPAAKSVSLGSYPLMGTWTPPIAVAGVRARTLASYASDSYFETLGIALLRGRSFTDRETAHGAPVAVISEATARRFWPGQDPLGKQFKLDKDFRGNFTAFEVIGVVRDVRFANLTRIDPAHVYLPTGDQEVYGILLRARGDAQSAMAAVRAGVQGLDRNLLQSLSTISLEKGPLRLQKSLAHTYAMYAGLLAGLALTLAGIGIYGVMAYLVSQRVAEIGVRMALGASPLDVLRLVVIQGLRPAFVGTLLGIAGAAGISWALHTTLVFPGSADFFYGVPFYDPATFLGLAGFLVALAGIATFVPARRAIRVDPMTALRYQ